MPFSFSFSFFFFSSLFLSFLSFSVFPFLAPFSFVLSFGLVVFRLFLVSPSPLFSSLPCFSLVADSVIMLFHFVSALRPPPHALLATLKYAYSPCVLSSCVLDADLFFSSLASLFRFRFGHGLFRPVFFLWALCCLLGFGFCCDSFSKLYDI